MVRLSLLAGQALQWAPRATLLARIARHAPAAVAWRCVAFFSGRVALAALAALPHFDRRIALLPAYLCNVVPMAFERQGWQVHGYAVDEAFQPDPQALQRQAAQTGAQLLVLAPLYGSDGGLAWWLGADGLAVRQRLGLTLVLDLCQDAGWLRALTAPGNNWAAVVSFNDKSFPGVMGAAVWTDLALPEPPAPPWRAALLLQLWSWRKLLPHRHRGEPTGYEHSQAARFPYGFEPQGATRLQLALGAIGLQWLPRWQARRRAAVLRGTVRPLTLPAAASSPFVVAAADDPGLHRNKPPYAQADDPSCSLRPGLVVRHNKGFDDR